MTSCCKSRERVVFDSVETFGVAFRFTFFSCDDWKLKQIFGTEGSIPFVCQSNYNYLLWYLCGSIESLLMWDCVRFMKVNIALWVILDHFSEGMAWRVTEDKGRWIDCSRRAAFYSGYGDHGITRKISLKVNFISWWCLANRQYFQSSVTEHKYPTVRIQGYEEKINVNASHMVHISDLAQRCAI